MIPLRDDIPSRTAPILNYALIAANVLAFFYELALGSGLDEFIHRYGVIPSLYFYRDVPLIVGVVPLFTSMFLHGGWLHIAGNLLYLYIFGDNVEDRFGHWRYLCFYLGAGVVAGLAHVVANASSTVPSIGASGAIGGVLGAYMMLYPRARVVTLIPIFVFVQFVELPALLLLGFWFLQQFLMGTLSLGAGSAEAGGVAWFAHIGGFLFGAILGRLLARPERRPTSRDVWWVRDR